MPIREYIPIILFYRKALSSILNDGEYIILLQQKASTFEIVRKESQKQADSILNR